MKKIKVLLLSVMVVGLLAACGAKAETMPVLSITGLGDTSFSQEELEGMPMVDSNYTNKDGETTTYKGISLADLLVKSGVESYSQLNMIASDGYSASITFDELSGCAECVISYGDDGWSSVMPDFSGKLQVKNVVELNVE